MENPSPSRPPLLDSKHIASRTVEWLRTSCELCCQSLCLHHCYEDPFPSCCSLFGSLTRVQLHRTHFTTSAPAGDLGCTCCLAIHHSGPPETAEYQLPLPTHLGQPFLRPSLRGALLCSSIGHLNCPSMTGRWNKNS